MFTKKTFDDFQSDPGVFSKLPRCL